MAKTEKRKINKSAEVRLELQKSGSGSPTEIVESLAKRGIEVSAAFVSNVKCQDKKKASGNVARLDIASTLLKGPKSILSDQQIDATSLLILKAVELVVEVGPKRARDLLDVAEKLVSVAKK